MSGLVSVWQANPQASLENLSQAIGNAGTPITRQQWPIAWQVAD